MYFPRYHPILCSGPLSITPECIVMIFFSPYRCLQYLPAFCHLLFIIVVLFCFVFLQGKMKVHMLLPVRHFRWAQLEKMKSYAVHKTR